MRILVCFDLPVKEPKERKEAAKFRKFLQNDGYHMLQYSVYVRLCNGMDSVQTHKRRIKAELPSHGSVRLIILTEKQYENIEILLGEPNYLDSETIKETLSVF